LTRLGLISHPADLYDVALLVNKFLLLEHSHGSARISVYPPSEMEARQPSRDVVFYLSSSLVTSPNLFTIFRLSRLLRQQ